MITHNQLSLTEVFDDCQKKFDNDKYQFLTLLDETIHLDEIVPISFVTHFHASTGRPRKHQLYPMLKAFAKANSFDKNYDPYKAAYGSMPTHAASIQSIAYCPSASS